MDLIAYHLLLGGGLPMHLRAAPKTKIGATGVKLVAMEISKKKFREIDRIEEITTAQNGDTVEIRMRVTWRIPRTADDANRLYLVNHEAEEDYDFLADSTTATTICQRLDEETKELDPRLRAAIIKTYFGCRGDKDPATLRVLDPNNPLFRDQTIPHPRDWEELWVRAQSNPQFLSTGTEGKYCIPDAFSTLVGFPLVRTLSDFWAQHVAPSHRRSK